MSISIFVYDECLMMNEYKMIKSYIIIKCDAIIMNETATKRHNNIITILKKHSKKIKNRQRILGFSVPEEK